jgi:hypothetical protein
MADEICCSATLATAIDGRLPIVFGAGQANFAAADQFISRDRALAGETLITGRSQERL